VVSQTESEYPGVEIEFKHTWEEEEKYIIEAWARDDLGGFSGKTTFPLKVVKAKSNLNYLEQISWIFVLFPKAFPILKYII